MASVYSNPHLATAGRRLARRLQEARQKHGLLQCPVCHHIFEGTHVLKCPACRTLISKAFREMPASALSEKMELDFFS
jgi:rubrerythrin